MHMSVSIGEALQKASETLNEAGIPEARKEARSLLAHVLDVDWTVFITTPENPISESSLNRFQELVARRRTLADLRGIIPYDGPPLSDDDIVRMVHEARAGRGEALIRKLQGGEE